MVGRLSIIAGLAAVALGHVLPRLPEPAEWLGLAAGLLLVSLTAVVTRRSAAYTCVPKFKWLALPWTFLLGLAWVSFHIDQRLAESLSPQDEDKVSRVVLRIETLPRLAPDSRRFEARVLESRPAGIPSHILVSWNAADYAGPYGRKQPGAGHKFPELVPGQVWRMSLNLRAPHGLSNPHGFDYEGYVFAQGSRAVGSVRGTPQYLYDQPWASLSVLAERARHRVREAMAPHLDGMRYGAVLLALAIGDQASVAPGE